MQEVILHIFTLTILSLSSHFELRLGKWAALMEDLRILCSQGAPPSILCYVILLYLLNKRYEYCHVKAKARERRVMMTRHLMSIHSRSYYVFMPFSSTLFTSIFFFLLHIVLPKVRKGS